MEAPNRNQNRPASEQKQAPAEEHPSQIINGIKVYPPSYLPPKATLHATRPAQFALKGIHIELIHVGLFLLILLFLFFSIWRRPYLR